MSQVKKKRYHDRPPPHWKYELPDISSHSDIMWIFWADLAQGLGLTGNLK